MTTEATCLRDELFSSSFLLLFSKGTKKKSEMNDIHHAGFRIYRIYKAEEMDGTSLGMILITYFPQCV